MDQELKAYLEQRFGSVDQRLDRVDHRLDGVEKRLDGVEHRLDGMEHRLDGVEGKLGDVDSKVDRMGVEVDQVKSNLRLMAEGHSVIYRGMDERYEHSQQGVDEVRSMLKVWNQLLTSRLDAVERDVRVLRERVGV